MKKALLKCIAASVAALTLLGAVTVIILKSPKKKSSFTESEETTVAALYTITDYNGKIALFKRGYSMPVEIFDVNTNSLPQSDRELIIVGVTAYSDEEAQKLVEDYTSLISIFSRFLSEGNFISNVPLSRSVKTAFSPSTVTT